MVRIDSQRLKERTNLSAKLLLDTRFQFLDLLNVHHCSRKQVTIHLQRCNLLNTRKNVLGWTSGAVLIYNSNLIYDPSSLVLL